MASAVSQASTLPEERAQAARDGSASLSSAGWRPWLCIAAPDESGEEVAAWARSLDLAFGLASRGLPSMDDATPVLFLDWPSCRAFGQELLRDIAQGHAASGADMTLPDAAYFPDIQFEVSSAGLARRMNGRPAPDGLASVTVNRHVPSLAVLRATPWLAEPYLSAGTKGLVLSFSEMCDMGCGMCPFFGREMPSEHKEYYGSYRLRRKGKDFASPEFVAASIDAFRSCFPLKAMSVFGPGEPFQNSRAVEIMELCAARGVALSFATNAHYLDEAAFRALETLPVGTVIVSLDAATAPTYAKVKPNGDYDRAMRAVERLSAGRSRGRGFRLCLSFIRQDHNRSEEAHFLQRFAGAADELAVTSKYHRGRPEHPPLWTAHEVLPCSSLDNSVHVLTDGDCWSCSAGVPDDLRLGNVLREGALAVLQAHERSVRQRLEAGQAMDACWSCLWWRQTQRREVFANGRMIRVERPYSYKVLG